MKKLILLIVFALAGLLGGTLYHTWNQWGTPSPNTAPVVVVIPLGSGPAAIGRILQDSGLIASPRSFRWYCRLTAKGHSLKAGAFEIPPGSTIRQMVDLIIEGRAVASHVTIPEGRASWEIFAILKAVLPRLDSATWDSLVHDSVFTAELAVPASSLEGWLYPNTYSFYYDATERDVISRMVNTGKAAIATLDTGAGSMYSTLGNWNRVMTLASIVEEETGKPGERAHVASVFHNRLRIGMPLGADPTVRYIFRNLTGPIYKSQLMCTSPYNTRRYAGLPPGPISNPGLNAIDAALHPLKTKDLFFVARDDGSGMHFFAETLEQHNRFKILARKNRKE